MCTLFLTFCRLHTLTFEEIGRHKLVFLHFQVLTKFIFLKAYKWISFFPIMRTKFLDFVCLFHTYKCEYFCMFISCKQRNRKLHFNRNPHVAWEWCGGVLFFIVSKTKLFRFVWSKIKLKMNGKCQFDKLNISFLSNI